MLDWNRKKKTSTKISGEKTCWKVRPLTNEMKAGDCFPRGEFPGYFSTNAHFFVFFIQLIYRCPLWNIYSLTDKQAKWKAWKKPHSDELDQDYSSRQPRRLYGGLRLSVSEKENFANLKPSVRAKHQQRCLRLRKGGWGGAWLNPETVKTDGQDRTIRILPESWDLCWIFIFKVFFFNCWSIVDLQCCVNFCYTAKLYNIHILLHYGLSQDIKYSPLCYIVDLIVYPFYI